MSGVSGSEGDTEFEEEVEGEEEVKDWEVGDEEDEEVEGGV